MLCIYIRLPIDSNDEVIPWTMIILAVLSVVVVMVVVTIVVILILFCLLLLKKGTYYAYLYNYSTVTCAYLCYYNSICYSTFMECWGSTSACTEWWFWPDHNSSSQQALCIYTVYLPACTCLRNNLHAWWKTDEPLLVRFQLLSVVVSCHLCSGCWFIDRTIMHMITYMTIQSISVHITHCQDEW